MQLTKYSWATYGIQNELLVAAFAVAFLAFGIFVSRYLFSKKEKNTLQKPIANENLLKEYAISKREYEVLKAMARGDSNREIADALYISESTVKTHVSNILIKLDSKRRTQAIQKAKEINLIG